MGAEKRGGYGFDYNLRSYDSCRKAAQRWANQTKAEYGLGRNIFGEWVYFRLPELKNRSGYECTCEVVSPEV